MENTYKCPVCGSAELRNDGVSYFCRYCRGEFTENELRSARQAAEGAASGNGAARNGAAVVGASARSPMLDGTAGAGGSGFSAPSAELIAELQRRASVSKPTVTSAYPDNEASGDRLRGSARKTPSGGKGNVSTAHGAKKKGANADNGSHSSDSENNVRFLDNVSLMNDTAYELVNGNANAWANIARDKGIINSKQHTEIKYIVATRNCIAHGSGDTVRITAELVNSARDYYELMRRTASQIR